MATLGTRVRGTILASVGGLLDARVTGRFVTRLARLDVTAAFVALDFIDVSDGAAITASVLGTLHALGGNASTARIEGNHGVDAFGSTHASKDRAALRTGGTGEARSKNGLGAL